MDKVSRFLLSVLLLSSFVAAEPGAILVDGRTLDGARLVSGDAKTVTLAHAGDRIEVPTASVVSVTFRELRQPPEPRPYNLYLRNGDRVAGTVLGGADGNVRVDGTGIKGLEFPLAEVTAVRFGRLVGAVQAKYDEVFAKELARGRDIVIVQRDTRPYPQPARVLAVGEKALRVRVAGVERDLELHKVFGFIRATEPPDRLASGVRVRLHLMDGGRVTVPLRRIDDRTIAGPAGTIERGLAWRIEFLGEHLAHLSDFDPIDVQEVALFGEAPRWRRDEMVHGGPLRLHGHAYARGLGVQARSRLEFVLGGRWRSLFVRCGIDDLAGPEGDAIFRVYADGRLLREVRRRRGEEPAVLTLPVDGVDRLVLEAAPGDSYISDFCDWADARVFNAPARDEPGEEK